jgi:hypothetical protein
MYARRVLSWVAIAAVVALSWTQWRPAPSEATVARAGQGVRFERLALPDASHDQRERPVQPALKKIAPWISAVGASVGAFDLRGQGFPGDGCLTDPRDDQLRVFPIPGSKGAGYAPFTLSPRGLRYDRTMAPIGCVPADINQDGRQDVVAYYWGRSPVIYYNVAPPGSTPGPASFAPTELVSPMQVWNTTALNVADIDGDGRLDLAIGNYFPDGARVLDAQAADDGRMQMQHSMGKAGNAGTNRLYLGHGSATRGAPAQFTDVSERWPTESARSWTLAMGLQDLTDDGLPEMYVANDFGPDQLLVNRSRPGDVRLLEVKGSRDLHTPRSKVLGHDSFKGMGVAYSYEQGADLPRIFVSNITTEWGLQESNLAFYPTGSGSQLRHGKLPYSDRAADVGFAHSGWSWDVKPLDVTNSGSDYLVQATGFLAGERNLWPRLQEMAMGNDQILSLPAAWLTIRQGDGLSSSEPNRLWAPSGDGFVDIGAAAGFEKGQISRGIAVGDFDADGRDDFLVADQWGPSYAYLNRSISRNPVLNLNVVRDLGEGAGTPLVGAKVTVTGQGYRRIAQLYPANGHSGVSGATVHFALPGDVSTHPLQVTVAWSQNGSRQVRTFPVTPGTHDLRIPQ